MRQPPAKRRGCLFYGCITLIFCALIAAIVGYIGVRYAVKSAHKLVEDYTETQPAPMPAIQLSDAESRALDQRLKYFQTALEHPTNAVELVLSAPEINALLAKQGLNRKDAPQVYVNIKGDQIKGNISIPLQDLGPLKFNGRYLNGLASLNVHLTNNVLSVRIDDVAVKGKPLPAIILSELKKENFAQEIQKDPETAKWISKFESIQIRDGKVILRNKVRP